MKTIVLEARALVCGSSGPALETWLRRQPGITVAEASYMTETVTVGFDETTTDPLQIRHLITDFGCTCQGEMLPQHLTSPVPAATAAPTNQGIAPTATMTQQASPAHDGHPLSGKDTAATVAKTQMAQEMGHDTGQSMEAMVRDMRQRLLVTFVLAIPILLYSPLATQLQI